MAESAYPQVLIDPDGSTADELIAPLITCARRHGLAIQSSSQGSTENPVAAQGYPVLAYIDFFTATEALEFLLQSAHLLDYQAGDQLGLFAHRPLVGTTPGAKVVWHPDYTHTLVAAWISS